MIIGWVGDFGSGKTGGMTHRLYQKSLAGSRIATNYGPTFEDEPITSRILQLMPESLSNMVMGVDEIHIFLDSRSTGKKKQKEITYFILQTRKRKVELNFTTQHRMQVDIRLRLHTDIWIECENLGCNDIDCPGNDERICDIPVCGWYRYVVWDGKTGQKRGKPFYLNGPKNFYHLYDTEKVILDLEDEDEDE